MEATPTYIGRGMMAEKKGGGPDCPIVSGVSVIHPHISVSNGGSIAIAPNMMQSSMNGKRVIVTPSENSTRPGSAEAQ